MAKKLTTNITLDDLVEMLSATVEQSLPAETVSKLGLEPTLTSLFPFLLEHSKSSAVPKDLRANLNKLLGRLGLDLTGAMQSAGLAKDDFDLVALMKSAPEEKSSLLKVLQTELGKPGTASDYTAEEANSFADTVRQLLQKAQDPKAQKAVAEAAGASPSLVSPADQAAQKLQKIAKYIETSAKAGLSTQSMLQMAESGEDPMLADTHARAILKDRLTKEQAAEAAKAQKAPTGAQSRVEATKLSLDAKAAEQSFHRNLKNALDTLEVSDTGALHRRLGKIDTNKLSNMGLVQELENAAKSSEPGALTAIVQKIQSKLQEGELAPDEDLVETPPPSTTETVGKAAAAEESAAKAPTLREFGSKLWKFVKGEANAADRAVLGELGPTLAKGGGGLFALSTLSELLGMKTDQNRVEKMLPVTPSGDILAQMRAERSLLNSTAGDAAQLQALMAMIQGPQQPTTTPNEISL